MEISMKIAKLVKFNMVCPGCKHEFQRKFAEQSVMKGKTSCIKCKSLFPRVEFYPDSEMAKIKDTQKRFDILNKLPIHACIVKGYQVPNSLAETKFKAKAIEKGWKPHRPSWPDFFVETENGIIFVEVKSKNDRISSDQAATFTLLELHGMKVFVWHDKKDRRDGLIPWKKWSKLFLHEVRL